MENAASVVAYLFGGLKIDGCSGNHNNTLWGALLADTGHPILTENHGNSLPHPVDASTPCPYNLYRTSTDIKPLFAKIVYNLCTITPYLRTDSAPSLARDVGRTPM